MPLRFISSLLDCAVDWNESDRIVAITSPGDVVKFPEPKVTVNYPTSKGDARMLWITIDNYRDFERECSNYEFKVEFLNPTEFNVFEQDEGVLNGWQSYRLDCFVKPSVLGPDVFTVINAYYTTRELKKSFVPYDGMDLSFKLTVHRKCSDETREYEYTDKLQLPFGIRE